MQLPLPIDEPPESLRGPIAPAGRVYVNRDLKMGRCAWIGFDLDYTLAIYRQLQMDELSIEATVNKLLARGYPELITELDYPLDFPIRGLLVDKKRGNLLKLNRFKVARRGYHGMRELSRAELRSLYYERKLRHKSSRYYFIDTLYALSEACMFATIVEGFDRRGRKVRYRKLFEDIRECIDLAHRDGAILDPVMADPGQYIERDPRLAGTLHKLRSAGKRLFLLTNSRWPYARAVLSYLLDGALPDYPSFHHYFDAIVVGARKPRFFEEQEPIMELRGDDLVPAKLPLERGRVYGGGNLRQLQRALGVTGNRVLYVGDHIYGDIVRSKKDSVWRTAMVIPELETEVAAQGDCAAAHERAGEVHGQRYELEDQLRFYRQRLKTLGRNGDEAANGTEEVDRTKALIALIRKQLRTLNREDKALQAHIDQRFHPYWGPLLKQAGELSLFGHQVAEYACVYTSRVSNLLAYSPQQYFRSPHNLMHHEL